VWQQAPGTATTEHVEDSVKDLTQGMYSGSSGSFGCRDMGLYVGPLGVGEVGSIRLSHAC
jgi:hypothetical protein